jgi:hypothetical protein
VKKLAERVTGFGRPAPADLVKLIRLSGSDAAISAPTAIPIAPSKSGCLSNTQGLTPEAAGQALRGVTEKVIGAADVAKQSVSRRVKEKDSSYSGGAPDRKL